MVRQPLIHSWRLPVDYKNKGQDLGPSCVHLGPQCHLVVSLSVTDYITREVGAGTEEEINMFFV